MALATHIVASLGEDSQTAGIKGGYGDGW